MLPPFYGWDNRSSVTTSDTFLVVEHVSGRLRTEAFHFSLYPVVHALRRDKRLSIPSTELTNWFVHFSFQLKLIGMNELQGRGGGGGNHLLLKRRNCVPRGEYLGPREGGPVCLRKQDLDTYIQIRGLWAWLGLAKISLPFQVCWAYKYQL